MKFFASFLTGGVLGFSGGLGVMLLIFPFLFPPPMVNELVEPGLHNLLETSFREGVSGQDLAHWGRGDLKIYRDKEKDRYLVEFQSNFEVGAGPNFWLYVNTVADIDDEDDFDDDEGRMRITKIKSFQGSQVYELTSAQYEGAQALTIWCESFGQYIASANLAS